MKPPSVVRVWMPAIFSAGAWLFLRDMAPIYWLFALPLLPIIVFMASLAEVHDEGQQICVKRSWRSDHIPKKDILRTSESFLEGIGVLQPRRFVFPWGRIYFVREWSAIPVEEQDSRFQNLLGAAFAAISGFVAARAGNIPGLRIETPHARMMALFFVVVLCFLFVITRAKKHEFSGFALFAAAFIVGLVHG